ncbi:hypothetical protein MP228_002914 [Amoeboaphelidium protococcarum]|nr:hypothetical protein MP228_002914 [Amoeboaphelidium protococcarum]
MYTSQSCMGLREKITQILKIHIASQKFAYKCIKTIKYLFNQKSISSKFLTLKCLNKLPKQRYGELVKSVRTYYALNTQKRLTCKRLNKLLTKFEISEQQDREFGESVEEAVAPQSVEVANAISISVQGNVVLFANQKNEKALCKYPVVVLDLKDCKGESRAQMYESVWQCIREMVLRHRHELAEEITLLSRDMDFTRMTPPVSVIRVASSLKWLTHELFEKYGKRVVVLVDEYDAPLNHAFRQSYYKEASGFFGMLYSQALKGNSALEKACLMGIVEVRSADILSGLNNIQVFSVADRRYSAFFGFSMDEIGSLIPEESTKKKVIDWYNGYCIGNDLLINPWSFMCWYSRDVFGSYQVGSSYTETIATILKPRLKKSLMEIFALLYDQKQVEVSQLSSGVNYSSEDWSIDEIIHYLVHTGYLTYHHIYDDDNNTFITSGVVWIPNKEIRVNWESNITGLLREQFAPQFRSRVEKALTSASLFISDLQNVMQDMMKFCSSHDHGSTRKNEYSGHLFYQGAFLSILHDGMNIIVTSNPESGLGRHDIRIRLLHLQRVFVFKFKLSQRESDLQEDAKMVLKQIIDYQNYVVADLHDCECFLVGVAFHGQKLSELAVHKIQL